MFLKMTTSPPVLLDSTRAGIVQRITGTILSAKLDKIYSNYEKYDLSYLFWLFWHAACDDTSPNGIMLYAACIEALQKKYSDENNGTILAPKDWHALLGELKDKVLQVNMQEKLKNQLITNLELINRRGLKQRKLDNFLDHLGLKLNRNEREAWAHRHNVAHGDCITADYKAFMKATKILKTIFTRILLCVTGASDEYIDYCYEGCPIKNIKSGDEVQINDN
ncbi:MAG: hypothetical protein GY730_02930 [bacterium]|nr:hypothetical protein [bacterium]